MSVSLTFSLVGLTFVIVCSACSFSAAAQEAGPDTSAIENVCPTPSDAGVRTVRSFLTSSDFADNRRKAKITHLKGKTAKALSSDKKTEKTDNKKQVVEPKVCRRLNQEYSKYINSEGVSTYERNYFKVNNTYIAILLPRTKEEYKEDNIVTIGLTILEVLDEDLNVIAGWSG